MVAHSAVSVFSFISILILQLHEFL